MNPVLNPIFQSTGQPSPRQPTLSPRQESVPIASQNDVGGTSFTTVDKNSTLLDNGLDIGLLDNGLDIGLLGLPWDAEPNAKRKKEG